MEGKIYTRININNVEGSAGMQGRIEQITGYMQQTSPVEVQCFLTDGSRSTLSFEVNSVIQGDPKNVSLRGPSNALDLFAEEIMEVEDSGVGQLSVRMDSGARFLFRPSPARGPQ